MAQNALSKRAFAVKIGVSRVYVSQILNAHRIPSLKLQRVIALQTAGAVPMASWINEPVFEEAEEEIEP